MMTYIRKVNVQSALMQLRTQVNVYSQCPPMSMRRGNTRLSQTQLFPRQQFALAFDAFGTAIGSQLADFLSYNVP